MCAEPGLRRTRRKIENTIRERLAMPTIADILKSVAPNAKSNYVDGFTNAQDLLYQFGINTPLRISHFIAQVLHETSGGSVLFENLNYTTPARLLQIFGVGRHSAAIRPEEVN